MQVDHETFRDEQGTLVDRLTIEGSRFDEAVVVHGDESVTLRAQTTDDQIVEYPMQLTGRQYRGVRPDTPDASIHEDLRNALLTVGFAVEPWGFMDDG